MRDNKKRDTFKKYLKYKYFLRKLPQLKMHAKRSSNSLSSRFQVDYQERPSLCPKSSFLFLRRKRKSNEGITQQNWAIGAYKDLHHKKRTLTWNLEKSLEVLYHNKLTTIMLQTFLTWMLESGFTSWIKKVVQSYLYTYKMTSTM